MMMGGIIFVIIIIADDVKSQWKEKVKFSS